jgi:hypothetical protein
MSAFKKTAVYYEQIVLLLIAAVKCICKIQKAKANHGNLNGRFRKIVFFL